MNACEKCLIVLMFAGFLLMLLTDPYRIVSYGFLLGFYVFLQSYMMTEGEWV